VTSPAGISTDDQLARCAAKARLDRLRDTQLGITQLDRMFGHPRPTWLQELKELSFREIARLQRENLNGEG